VSEVGEAELEALRAAVKRVEEVLGCGDGSCRFVRPNGMHTNTGCRCLESRKPFGVGCVEALFRAAKKVTS
jgi:hypothetical protein